MNYLQFLLFFIYVLSTLIAGIAIFEFIGRKKASSNSWVYLGEVLLLGSILIYGELMLLSLLGLYKAPFLWAIVLCHYLFLFAHPVRHQCVHFFTNINFRDIPTWLFAFILMFFFLTERQ